MYILSCSIPFSVRGVASVRLLRTKSYNFIFSASVGRSVGHGVTASVQEADNVFDGFSYVPPVDENFE